MNVDSAQASNSGGGWVGSLSADRTDGNNSDRFAVNNVDAGSAEPGEPSPATPGPCFPLTALLQDLRPHVELDRRTLGYHLRQSDATAADGYHHASINEARSFLEALVVTIVHAVQRHVRTGDVNDNAPNGGCNGIRNGGQNGTAFRHYRRYLLDIGLTDHDENELLQFVYSVASAKGSHHGVTDEAWTRLARRIVFAAGQHTVQRYAAWKRNGMPVTPPPDKAASRPRRNWLSFWRRLPRQIATRLVSR